MRWKQVAVASATMFACSSPAGHREHTAREFVDHARGKSVFGPAAEFLASDLKEVGASGMFATRPAAECDVAVIAGGEDSFATRMEMLKQAKHSIRIQALIFTGDESGLRIAEVLREKKQQGVDVKVIVDGISNPSLQTQWMYFDLKLHGIEVEGYEALGLQLANEIPIPLLTPHYDPQLPNRRIHEKLWIVDAGTPNAQAVMGGLNIANEYFRVDPTNTARYWRDQDIAVRGAVIADLTTTFDRNYDHFKNLKVRRGALTDKAWDAARKIMEKTGKPKVELKRVEVLSTAVTALEARPPARDYQQARCRMFQSRPRLRETFIQQAYLKLLATAKREVLIANAYFVPTPSIRLAIVEAALRCVRVVVLTNGPETSDTPGMSLLGRGHYAELLSANTGLSCPNKDAGVEVWEYTGKAANAAKQTEGLLHAKFAVVDREVSLVGSYNLDPRSERLNSESALVYESTALAEQLGRTFVERDLAVSRRVGADEAAGFEKPATVFRRLQKDFAGLFESQL